MPLRKKGSQKPDYVRTFTHSEQDQINLHTWHLHARICLYIDTRVDCPPSLLRKGCRLYWDHVLSASLMLRYFSYHDFHSKRELSICDKFHNWQPVNFGFLGMFMRHKIQWRQTQNLTLFSIFQATGLLSHTRGWRSFCQRMGVGAGEGGVRRPAHFQTQSQGKQVCREHPSPPWNPWDIP